MPAPQPEGPSAVGRDQGVFGSGLGVSWWLAERGVDLKAIRRDRGARRHPNDGHGRREQPHADYRTSRHQEIGNTEAPQWSETYLTTLGRFRNASTAQTRSAGALWRTAAIPF